MLFTTAAVIITLSIITRFTTLSITPIIIDWVGNKKSPAEAGLFYYTLVLWRYDLCLLCAGLGGIGSGGGTQGPAFGEVYQERRCYEDG